ncbi:MAG: sodium/proton-translocating pyrophosphatase, partial [Candidatus Methylomirabilales bacterium]
MSEAQIVLPTFGVTEWRILWFVLLSAFVALAYGAFLAARVLKEDPGSPAMIRVAAAIEEGAMAYLARQVKTMIWFVLIITVGLYFMYRGIYEGLTLPLGVALAFFMGVAASYGAGYVGMWLAVKGNVRTANAALKSFKTSL